MLASAKLLGGPAGRPPRRRRAKILTPSLFPAVPHQRDTEPSAQPVAPGIPGHGCGASGRPTASSIGPLPALPHPTGSVQIRHPKPAAELAGIARLAPFSPPAPPPRTADSPP